TERMGSAFDPYPLLGRRVVAEIDLGVQLGGDLPGAPRLDRRCLPNDQPARLAGDSILEHPRARGRFIGTRPVPFLDPPDTKPKSGDLVVEENAVILAGLETKSLDDFFGESHGCPGEAPGNFQKAFSCPRPGAI